jgi:hypothetical protein
MNIAELGTWYADWAWSLPLIVLNVVIHIFGFALIYNWVVRVLGSAMAGLRFLSMFATVMGVTVTLATALHGIEAAVWAAAFWLLGALPDVRSAMLYSLGAMTTYGHASIYLENHWQLMGALEALNGVLLFGLTTAFLFAMIQNVRLLGSGERDWKS